MLVLGLALTRCLSKKWNYVKSFISDLVLESPALYWATRLQKWSSFDNYLLKLTLNSVTSSYQSWLHIIDYADSRPYVLQSEGRKIFHKSWYYLTLQRKKKVFCEIHVIEQFQETVFICLMNWWRLVVILLWDPTMCIWVRSVREQIRVP